jgi:acetyl-CoA decarbonylase/synthase complex subunit gamma
MPLTALDFFKLLPKTNCGDCGVPTCLAFAMRVAAKQVAVEACPHLTEQAKQALGAAGAPPQKLVRIGAGERALEIGNETVMFRHEEKFHRKPGIAVLVNDTDDVQQKAQRIAALRFERVGQQIGANMAALNCASRDAARFKDAAQQLHGALGLPMVLIAARHSDLADAAKALAAARPLLWERNGPSDQLVQLAVEAKLPIVVEGDLAKCDAATQKAKAAGVEDMVLCPGQVGPADALEFLTLSRRAALKANCRPLGFPVLVRAWAEDPVQQSLEACHYACKYAGIVVMDLDRPEHVLPVLTTVQDVYIDPQKPVQVEPKLYDIGEPGDKSPLLVTTNFSLTFYSVLSEVEASRVPARLLAVDTEGTSVLTAWAADKFGPEQIKKAMQATGALEKLDAAYRRPVIPGLVAVISGELEEEIGCGVIVGPKEAGALPSFLKNEWHKLVG